MIAETRSMQMAGWLADAHRRLGDGTGLPAVEGGYSRTLLFADDEHEIVGFRWSPGAATTLHDHGRSRCATLLVSGGLHVERYHYDPRAGFLPAAALDMRAGDLDDSDGEDEFHRVTAIAGEETMTVHVYTPPLGAYRVAGESGELRLSVGSFTAR